MLGLLWFSRAPVDGDYLVDVLPAMLPMGVGAGLAFPAMMTLAMSGATRADAGLASGLVNTTQQVGGALGLAVLVTLSTGRSDDLLAGGESTAKALTEGYQLAFAIAAGLVVAALVVAATVLRPAAVAVRRGGATTRSPPTPRRRSGSAGGGAVAHGLDVVPVGIEHEGAVVARVVDLAHAGAAVVARPGRESGLVERVHGRAVRSGERHVRGLGPSARPEPELGLAVRPVAHHLRELEQPLHPQRHQRGVVERLGRIEVGGSDHDVVQHGRDQPPSALAFSPAAASPSRKSRTRDSAGPRSSIPSMRPGSASSQ